LAFRARRNLVFALSKPLTLSQCAQSESALSVTGVTNGDEGHAFVFQVGRLFFFFFELRTNVDPPPKQTSKQKQDNTYNA
jgi:hypothetical protein